MFQVTGLHRPTAHRICARTLPATMVLLVLSACAGQTGELEWQEEDGYRWAPLDVTGREQPGFERLPQEKTGVSFANYLPEDEWLRNRHYVNGAGVAVGDVDGDGLADLYFTGLSENNRLYRNLGNWEFEDITEAAGVAHPDRYSSGAVLADTDGDGDLDLLVTSIGGPHAAYENDGTGRFIERTDAWGLASNKGSTTMALADTDGDGDLDLYIGSYKKHTVKDLFPPEVRQFDRTVEFRDGAYRVVPELQEHYRLKIQRNRLMRFEYAEPDDYYLNRGDGTFERVSYTSGTFLDANGDPFIEEPHEWALTARFQDIDGDGDPDLLVCNDFESPDFLFENVGDGTFRWISELAMRKSSQSTMSVDFSDVDRDGDLDFFLTDMLATTYTDRQRQVQMPPPELFEIGDIETRPQVFQNTLFANRGDMTFAEIAHFANMVGSGWSWSSVFLDVDLDGYEDLLISTGHEYDAMDTDAQIRAGRLPPGFDWKKTLTIFPDLNLRNLLYHNKANLRFELIPGGWGFGDEADITQGFALGDLDNDGDLDVIANRLQASAGLYRNRSDRPRIGVRLSGTPPNTRGIGARIFLRGGPVDQSKEIIAGGMYLSGSQPQAMFAASEGEEMEIEVRWRSGKRSVIQAVLANRMYEVFEDGSDGDARPNRSVNADSIPGKTASAAPNPDRWFRRGTFAHTHDELRFNDQQRQPMLPRRLSQAGPAAVIADFDEDGRQDILVGGGSAAGTKVYRNLGEARFRLWQTLPNSEGRRDFGAAVAGAMEPGTVRVVVAESGYETASTSILRVYRVRNGSWAEEQSIAFGEGAVGSLNLVDVDGDQDLDLFATSRFMPGRYPENAGSTVFLWEDTSFVPSATWSEAFQDAGLVWGSTFGDLDADGDADAVLATQWGPIRIFENSGEGFSEITGTAGMESLTGWWAGVSLGDFDSDGRLDVFATNWGWNSSYGQPEEGEPLRLYYGDGEGDGVIELIEASYQPFVGGYAPHRGLGALSAGMPVMRNWIRSYSQFSTMGIEEVLGQAHTSFRTRNTAVLGQMVFLNRGDHFEAREVPAEAQWSPGWSAAVGDYNLDGMEDVFISQNFFAVPDDMTRQDGGRGLLLAGDGDGRFAAADGSETGIRTYGDQRGAATGDLNGDGKPDLLVTQNGAATHLYLNRRDKSGAVIRLEGAPGNRWCVGATVRLVYADGSLGPARPIQAGTGYWSQHASTVILGIGQSSVPESVEISWPDGSKSRHDFQPVLEIVQPNEPVP